MKIKNLWETIKTWGSIEVTLAVVLQRGFRVVVAGKRDHATCTARVFTRTIIHVGLGVEITGTAVGAASKFARAIVEVGVAVVVGRCLVVAAAKNARPIVFTGRDVVVEGTSVCATSATKELA